MKSLFKVAACAVSMIAVSAMAGSYPFPQNKKYPHGHIIEYANTDMIKQHYSLWKQGWYDASQGWVLAPEGTCSTVSEAIAYGMLISVYMDDQTVFDKLYGTWKSNGGNGAGMNWRVGCSGGTGSASDADFDAALALVMASKQWGGSYLGDAKKIISWIATNDINGNKIKPGNQWNDAFNPSYATTANFQLFQDVNGGSWSSVISQAYTDLNACQDATTGLVPDWCDWNSHKPTLTSAAVANDKGFYDDAARTPWRMAWAYYWYGDSKAQAFNQKVVSWLIPTTRTASGVNSGYKWQDYMSSYIADESEERNFVSSTFSGGLGLAASSINSNEAKTYLGTVFKVLKEKKSCTSANGCGTSVAGEKYYPATLNMLYLLLVTGNMPNFYNMSGFTSFTPDTTKAPSVGKIEGEQQAHGDTTVSLSGLWNWGAYHDKLGIGTKMVPDSGSSPLYKKQDGSFYVEASMEIGPEPEWTPEAAAAGTLKYPSAGIAVSFKKDECKQTKTCGVDFTALGIKYVRVTAKTSGPIRMAVLNTITDENDEKKIENAGAGTEPGIYVDNSDDYTAVTYDMTPDQFGFKGLGNGNTIGILDWVNKNKVPPGEEIIKNVRGFKWEVKDAKGGLGEISIKSIEFLDASKQPIDPVKLTGISISSISTPSSSSSVNPGSSSSGSENPGSSASVNPESSSSGTDAIPVAAGNMVSGVKVVASGMQVHVLGAKLGSSYAVFDVQGKALVAGRIGAADQGIAVPYKGVFLVRIDGKIHMVSVK